MSANPKIKVQNPIVELDGDEMTRIIWQWVKERLIFPYLDLKTIYFDLGMQNRDLTNDQVTIDSAHAIHEYGVGVKCATITPNDARVKEYNLKQQWKSPNGTIRGILDGTVFRKPIVFKNVRPAVSSWKKPITIGRHAFGDLYKNVEMSVGEGTVSLVYTPRDGSAPTSVVVNSFNNGGGVVMGMFNVEKSMRNFAKACVSFAVSERTDLWFSAKETISKTYHAAFMNIFEEEVAKQKDALAKAGVSYTYRLIDDAAAQLVRIEGNIIWALMNYDGDVMSDVVASGFGSLGNMTSVLVTPDGKFEYEAAHGTVTRHYRDYQKGLETSTNSIATIFAWTGALRKRGELDKNTALINFADSLEAAIFDVVEGGTFTKDMARLVHDNPNPPRNLWVNTEEFLGAIDGKLKARLQLA